MVFVDTAEQAIQQIIVCFSFLNFVFALTLNKGKSLPGVFGLIFSIPIVLAIISYAYPEMELSAILFDYSNLMMITAVLLFTFTRVWGFVANLFLVAAYIFLIVFWLKSQFIMPLIIYSPLFQGVITVIITAITALNWKQRINDDHFSIYWGILILGAMQAVQLFFPQMSVVLMGAGVTIAYSLFFTYIFKNTIDPYAAKLKQAEFALTDMKKAVNYEVRKRIVEIERHNEHLRNTMQKDPLVDAFNGKAVTDYMKNLIEESEDERFTVLLFDIDSFKSINDLEGHLAGDKVLKKITLIAKENIRSIDVLGRYGGDEFLIVLPGTSVSESMMVAERFRKQANSQSGTTVSIGVASFPADGRTVQELIAVADKGLYESKNKGKDSVTHYKVLVRQ